MTRTISVEHLTRVEGHGGITVVVDGKNVSNLPAHTKADLGLVLVPEGRQLFTDMTVYENLEMGAYPGRAWKQRESMRPRCLLSRSTHVLSVVAWR